MVSTRYQSGAGKAREGHSAEEDAGRRGAARTARRWAFDSDKPRRLRVDFLPTPPTKFDSNDSDGLPRAVPLAPRDRDTTTAVPNPPPRPATAPAVPSAPVAPGATFRGKPTARVQPRVQAKPNRHR